MKQQKLTAIIALICVGVVLFAFGVYKLVTFLTGQITEEFADTGLFEFYTTEERLEKNGFQKEPSAGYTQMTKKGDDLIALIYPSDAEEFHIGKINSYSSKVTIGSVTDEETGEKTKIYRHTVEMSEGRYKMVIVFISDKMKDREKLKDIIREVVMENGI